MSKKKNKNQQYEEWIKDDEVVLANNIKPCPICGDVLDAQLYLMIKKYYVCTNSDCDWAGGETKLKRDIEIHRRR